MRVRRGRHKSCFSFRPTAAARCRCHHQTLFPWPATTGSVWVMSAPAAAGTAGSRPLGGDAGYKRLVRSCLPLAGCCRLPSRPALQPLGLLHVSSRCSHCMGADCTLDAPGAGAAAGARVLCGRVPPARARGGGAGGAAHCAPRQGAIAVPVDDGWWGCCRWATTWYGAVGCAPRVDETSTDSSLP